MEDGEYQYLVEGFEKLVPTDMEWGGTYKGGWVIVYFWPITYHKKYNPVQARVSIWGTDDGYATRRFNTNEEALKFYNSIKYLRTLEDLSAFDINDPNVDIQGPSELLPLQNPDNFTYPPIEEKLPRWMDEDATPYDW